MPSPTDHIDVDIDVDIDVARMVNDARNRSVDAGRGKASETILVNIDAYNGALRLGRHVVALRSDVC